MEHPAGGPAIDIARFDAKADDAKAGEAKADDTKSEENPEVAKVIAERKRIEATNQMKLDMYQETLKKGLYPAPHLLNPDGSTFSFGHGDANMYDTSVDWKPTHTSVVPTFTPWTVIARLSWS